VHLLPTNQKDRIKVVVAIAAVGLGLCYWAYPYEARSLELEEARERVERLEDSNLKARREIARGTAKTLRAQAARSRATLDVLRQLVPAAYEVPAVLEEVSTAARRAGLEIGGVQPEPVLVGEAFDTHRYRVTVVGGYHPLTTFLANVGSLPRIVAPVTFQLLPSPKQAAMSATTPRPKNALRNEVALQAQLTIQTYVMRPTADTAHAGPAAGGADAVGARIAERTTVRGGEVMP
jgi:type IV pilus assembly protein PilO